MLFRTRLSPRCSIKYRAGEQLTYLTVQQDAADSIEGKRESDRFRILLASDCKKASGKGLNLLHPHFNPILVIILCYAPLRDVQSK